MILRKYIGIWSLGIWMLLALEAHAQQRVLTLDEAITQALQKNFNIQLANQRTEIAQTEIYRGNAGLLPTLDWIFNLGTNFNYVNQQFVDGRLINRFGQTYAPNSSFLLNWTLYDGRRMQTNYELLKTRGQQQVVQGKLATQQTVEAVMQTYFEILRQKQSVEFLNTIIKFYNERLQLTQQRWEIGRASKLDFLQSKTDLTAQQTTLVQAQNVLANAKVRLNNLMGQTPTTPFEVTEVMQPLPIYSLEHFIAAAKERNQDLLALQKNIEINQLNEKVAQSFRLPRVALNAGFGYALVRSNTGIFKVNQNVGLNPGLTASWNIFNGEQVRRDIQVAKLNTQLTRTQQEQLLLQLQTDIVAAYNQYQTDSELRKIEEENKQLAEENLMIALEKFKLGASTILEINEAQRRFDTSVNRLVNAEYNQRMAALELLRLSGELVR